jgi:hypothetical protein
MQIAIGQGRRNGKENEKEETELGIEIWKKKLSLAFQLAFSTSNVKLHYTSFNKFPIRRVSPFMK